MKIRTFIKRLNATELGLGSTNDTYVAIPNEADLSEMFENNVAITIEDKNTGNTYSPENSNIKYTQTGQNNQERISGLGEFFRSRDAKVGDEIIIEKSEDKEANINYSMSLEHRNVIVLQKGKNYAEIIGEGDLEKYKNENDYYLHVRYGDRVKDLIIQYKESRKKKTTSPNETDYYDLVFDNESILKDFAYQEYIEISSNNDQQTLNRMITYMEHILEWED